MRDNIDQYIIGNSGLRKSDLNSGSAIGYLLSSLHIANRIHERMIKPMDRGNIRFGSE